MKKFTLSLFVVFLAVLVPLQAGRGYTNTKYPIVLCHGMAGWDSLLGIYDYFYRVSDVLESGGADVYLTTVSQFHQTEVRGEQLLAQIEEIVAVSGADKVNLIGHSHGGLDARYVAAVRPDLVASVTSIGSPHKGADLADWLLADAEEGGIASAAFVIFGEALGSILGALTGHANPQDAVATIYTLSTPGTAAFNSAYPQALPTDSCGSGQPEVNGVRYYSWSGTSVFTNVLDPIDYVLSISTLVYDDANDGLVEACSAHLGEVIRDDYNMNHFDEVNQVLGLHALFSTDPLTLFRTHANRLKKAKL